MTFPDEFRGGIRVTFPPAFPSVPDDYIGVTLIEVLPDHRSGRARWWAENGQGYTDEVMYAGLFDGTARVRGSATAHAVSVHVVIENLKNEARIIQSMAAKLTYRARKQGSTTG